jgi:hypothetical protein
MGEGVWRTLNEPTVSPFSRLFAFFLGVEKKLLRRDESRDEL